MPYETYYKNRKCYHESAHSFLLQWLKKKKNCWWIMLWRKNDCSQCSECWSWKEVRGEVAKYLGCWYRHPRWHPVSTNNISSFFFPLLPLSRFLSLFLSYFLFLSRICLFLLLTLIRNIKNYYTISVFLSLIWQLYANCVIWYLRMV